ncbi:hypothetical protein ABK040_013023 [Willaertia magna]
MRIGKKVVNDKILRSMVERVESDHCSKEYDAFHECAVARGQDRCLGFYTKYMICINRANEHLKKTSYTSFGTEFGKFSARTKSQ